MIIEYEGKHTDEEIMTEPVPTHIEIWWDYISRIWIIQTKGNWCGHEGIQVDCTYEMNKPQVMNWIKNFRTNDLPIHLFKNGNELVKVYK
jgi:hypothetical protein